jgi:hypothetical protein
LETKEHEYSYDGNFGISSSKMGFVILMNESNGRTSSKSWLLDIGWWVLYKDYGRWLVLTYLLATHELDLTRQPENCNNIFQLLHDAWLQFTVQCQ